MLLYIWSIVALAFMDVIKEFRKTPLGFQVPPPSQRKLQHKPRRNRSDRRR